MTGEMLMECLELPVASVDLKYSHEVIAALKDLSFTYLNRNSA